MTPEQVFSLANTSVLPAWLLLIFFPRWRWTQTAAAWAVPGLLALSYGVILGSHWGESRGEFTTLAGVRQLFSSDWALLAGWIHYLAFDLFIGAWLTRDAISRNVSRWLLIPCLPLTFLLGPLGLLLYFILAQPPLAVRPPLAATPTDRQ